jgi:hypothetical protein
MQAELFKSRVKIQVLVSSNSGETMSTLYRNREEKHHDLIVANIVVDRSIRYSLTEGGRLLPFSDEEKESMREEQAMAAARLAIDRAMQS